MFLGKFGILGLGLKVIRVLHFWVSVNGVRVYVSRVHRVRLYIVRVLNVLVEDLGRR